METYIIIALLILFLYKLGSWLYYRGYNNGSHARYKALQDIYGSDFIDKLKN